MVTPVPVRHTYPRAEICPVCRIGLSNKERAVIVHQDPTNPERPYIHPVHKKCLLDGYRINQIANCSICRVPLDMQTLILAGTRQREVALVRQEEDTSLIEHVAYSVFFLVPLPLFGMAHAGNEFWISMRNNRTNIQDLDGGSWYPDPAALFVSCCTVAWIGTIIHTFISEHRRSVLIDHARDSLMLGAAVGSGQVELQGIPLIVAFFLLAQATQVARYEEMRNVPRRMFQQIKSVVPLIKDDLIAGAVVGLSARIMALGMLSTEEAPPLQKRLASSMVISSVTTIMLLISAYGRGIWRATHPNRN